MKQGILYKEIFVNGLGFMKLIVRVKVLTLLVIVVAACGSDDSADLTTTEGTNSGDLPVVVLQHFEQHFGVLKTETGETMPPVTISHEEKDLDNDGKKELFVYNSYLCGSSGCSGPVYSEKSEDGSYCYVATGHSTDFVDDLIVVEPLTCRDYENSVQIHISDMKKFVRPE